MATRTTVVEGDTTPPVEAVLSDEHGPAPLLGASVEFRMEPVPESGLSVPVLVAPATIVDENAPAGDRNRGRVRYQWASGDTDTPGIYRVQFTVTFGDGSQETFPTGYDEVVIVGLVAP